MAQRRRSRGGQRRSRPRLEMVVVREAGRGAMGRRRRGGGEATGAALVVNEGDREVRWRGTKGGEEEVGRHAAMAGRRRAWRAGGGDGALLEGSGWGRARAAEAGLIWWWSRQQEGEARGIERGRWGSSRRARGSGAGGAR